MTTTPYFRARLGESGTLYPVTTWERLSTSYRLILEQYRVRFLPFPACYVIDEDGSVYAHVSITGRIWRGHPDDKGLRTECLFEPQKKEPAFA